MTINEANRMPKEIKNTLSEIGLELHNVEEKITLIMSLVAKNKFMEAWQILSKQILNPSIPFAYHKRLFDMVYKESGIVPAPCWIPGENEQLTSNIGLLQKELGAASYEELYSWSIKNREAFWEKLTNILGIQFKTMPKGVLKYDNDGSAEWMPGGTMNIYDSCINGPHNQAAIIYQNESGEILKQTYEELDIECSRVARGLIELGLCKGDSVAVDMVMTIESVAIYLGILKAGCVAVSIADSLAPKEIQKRLMISKAKVVFTHDVIIRGTKTLPLYEKVLEAKPERVVVLPIQGNLQVTIRKQDILWDDFLFDHKEFSSVVCDPMDSINILFSSGTTGEPKAIPWNHTTPIKCASDGFLHHDIKQGDVVCWPTNLGWMMGPWLIFATLINKGTIALCYAPPYRN